MTPKRVKQLREIISGPNYYYDRAIEAAETYGALSAELLTLSLQEARGRLTLSYQRMILERRQKKYYSRMLWYTKKHAEQL